MPTVGWIQETAIDLFLERGFSAHEKGSATKFKCRECSMEFSSIAERSQHERLHPVANPMLTIDGREVMGDNFKLTRAVGPEDIVLSCVDEIELNGDVLGHPDELLKQLCSAKKGFFDIKLSRRGIRPKRIKIDLLVASLTQLERVDQSFLRLFGRDDFDGDTISHFISETEGCDEVIWYRDGLIRYLHGVMAKDQRAERLTTEDFAKCFNRSHQLLVQYPTALSYSLSQLIKFSFNDFSDFHGRSSISRLDDALMLFRGDTILTNAGDQNVILKLPTDHITSRILNDYVAHFSRYTLESLELAIDQINISKLVNQDRQKLNYLRYLKATEEGNLKAQRNYGTKLKYSEVFNVTFPESEASDV